MVAAAEATTAAVDQHCEELQQQIALLADRASVAAVAVAAAAAVAMVLAILLEMASVSSLRVGGRWLERLRERLVTTGGASGWRLRVSLAPVAAGKQG